MTGNEYQELAMRTKNPEINGYDSLRNAAYGLNGEAGEVIDLLKKHEFQGHKLDRIGVVDELGDVLWYVALACDALGLQMDYVMLHNVEKLKQRYPDGFDQNRSVNRELIGCV